MATFADMRALVTGGTGFVGRRILSKTSDPVVLSRDPDRVRSTLKDLGVWPWQPEQGPPPAEAFGGVEAVFHLAGERVGQGRWTREKKRRIRASRVVGTRNLVAGLAALPEKPRVLVSASAVGYYGTRKDEILEESAGPGTGFLAEVCRQWEAEARRAENLGVRVVCVRIGLVLGNDGGALKRILPLFRKGLGGRLGNGRQWWPWVHIDDLADLMMFAARTGDLAGPVNGVSPNPVTNRQFTQALAAALDKRALFPAPGLALKIALGEFASVLLASQRVVPERATRAGFRFSHPDLAPALADLLG